HRSTCSRTTSYTWVTASSTPPHATLFRAGPVPAVPSRGDRLPGGPRGGVPGAAVARPRAREVAARHPAPAHRRSDRGRDHALPRSEEHTSELQSRENLVCRLLLVKKKRET